MPFDVCEASLDDIPTISAIEAAAFGPEALQNLMFPPEPTRDSYGPWADEKYRDQLKSPVCKFLMAKDTDKGEVVSVSKWYFYEKAADIDPKPTVMGSFPAGANGELYNHWKKLMKDKRTEIMGKKPYYLLALLTTHPTHQRRGAGSALVTHGTDLADAAGLPCYLEASPEGYGLYRKYGFERVDTIVLPLEDWGGEGEWTGVVMVRLPKRG